MDSKGTVVTSKTAATFCVLLVSRQVRGRLASQMKIRFISEMVVRLVAISPQFFPQSRDYNVFIININTRLRL